MNRFPAQNEAVQQQIKYTLWAVPVGLAVIALLIGLQ